MNASVARISIFPIKSLDGVAVDRATVLASGALRGDREFALVDEAGKFVNGKRNNAIHRIKSTFDLDRRLVTLNLEGKSNYQIFSLDRDILQLEDWFSTYFGFTIKLIQNTLGGFPDDTDSPAPTIISIATLDTVTSWFSYLNIEETRKRFRTNIELNTDTAFWEDRLFSAVDRVKKFSIGNVEFEGINPCQRCIVPTRNTIDGIADSSFQKIFTNKRRETLPDWVEKSRFNHFYRLAVNTRLTSIGDSTIRVGDAIEVRSED
jgi:uncharacterized protein